MALFRCFTALLFACTLFQLACPVGLQAMGQKPPQYSAGYLSVNTWDTLTRERIALHLWYPSTSGERKVNLQPHLLTVARNGKPVEGTFPLVIISHATAESGLAHHTLASALARSGFAVAAPTHPGDNLLDTRRVLSSRQITDRLRQIPGVLDSTLTQPLVGPIIDNSSVALLGYGVGGTAALILAGATPRLELIAEYCEATKEQSVYCSSWAQKRLAPLATFFAQQDANPQDGRFKAFAAVVPEYAMLFAAPSLAKVAQPVLLAGAGDNTLNPPSVHYLPLQAWLPEKTRFVFFPHAREYSFQAPCSGQMQSLYPSLCQNAPEENRHDIQARLLTTLRQFFAAALPGSPLLP